ncbi:Putative Phytoene dehydrogenase OS=Streptomyces glaucescens OX=1907 GN=crtI PE=3 SV=1 [Streptomyces glaucescens]
MSDPSLLITRPTATDPSLAPPGHHLHYILAPCPNTDIGPRAAAWSDLGPRYRDTLLRELERRGLDGIEAAIQEECDHSRRLAGPGTRCGDALLGGPHLRPDLPLPAAQSGPGHRERRTRPGRTTPGVGVPTVLLSGKLAAARITGARSTAKPPAAKPPSGKPSTAKPSTVKPPAVKETSA